MPRTRIKFCGITRPADARAAAHAGADAIGVVLHADSRRKVSIDAARQILRELPPFVTPVGLFADAPATLVLEISSDLGLRHIQLHGNENPTILAALSGRVIIKALHLNDMDQWHGVRGLASVLLDNGAGGGIENDWAAIQRLQTTGGLKDLPPLIVAGGLTPENVGAVVRLLRPWAVDVSSGIESAPGIKSAEKMSAFVKEVRETICPEMCDINPRPVTFTISWPAALQFSRPLAR